jgi:hypothetical protein
MVLLGTGALIATDRQTVPDVSQHTMPSAISLAATFFTHTAIRSSAKPAG